MPNQTPLWSISPSLQGEILRLLGYPAKLSSASIQLGYPYFASTLATFQPYAQLQNKIAWLEGDPAEAIPIFGAIHPQFGAYYLAAQFQGTVDTTGTITNGAKLGAVVNGTAVSVTAATDTPATLTAKLVVAMNANVVIAALVAAASAPNTQISPTAAVLTVSSTQAGQQGNGVTVVLTSTDPTLLVSPTYYEQNLGAPVATGVLSGGADPPGPSIPIDAVNFPVFGYIPILRLLEQDVGYSRRNLSASIAADVTLRSTELAERGALLERFRREMADRLSVPVNPDMAGNRSRRMQRVV